MSNVRGVLEAKTWCVISGQKSTYLQTCLSWKEDSKWLPQEEKGDESSETNGSGDPGDWQIFKEALSEDK
jgi:hypothetical protein